MSIQTILERHVEEDYSIYTDNPLVEEVFAL